MANKANVTVKYTVLVHYRNVDVCEYDVPDLLDPETTNNLISSARIDFESHEAGRDSVTIMEVETEHEDIDYIVEPDDRPTTMPEGGAY